MAEGIEMDVLDNAIDLSNQELLEQKLQEDGLTWAKNDQGQITISKGGQFNVSINIEQIMSEKNFFIEDQAKAEKINQYKLKELSENLLKQVYGETLPPNEAVTQVQKKLTEAIEEKKRGIQPENNPVDQVVVDASKKGATVDVQTTAINDFFKDKPYTVKDLSAKLDTLIEKTTNAIDQNVLKEFKSVLTDLDKVSDAVQKGEYVPEEGRCKQIYDKMKEWLKEKWTNFSLKELVLDTAKLALIVMAIWLSYDFVNDIKTKNTGCMSYTNTTSKCVLPDFTANITDVTNPSENQCKYTNITGSMCADGAPLYGDPTTGDKCIANFTNTTGTNNQIGPNGPSDDTKHRVCSEFCSGNYLISSKDNTKYYYTCDYCDFGCALSLVASNINNILGNTVDDAFSFINWIKKYWWVFALIFGIIAVLYTISLIMEAFNTTKHVIHNISGESEKSETSHFRKTKTKSLYR